MDNDVAKQYRRDLIDRMRKQNAEDIQLKVLLIVAAVYFTAHLIHAIMK